MNYFFLVGLYKENFEIIGYIGQYILYLNTILRNFSSFQILCLFFSIAVFWSLHLSYFTNFLTFYLIYFLKILFDICFDILFNISFDFFLAFYLIYFLVFYLIYFFPVFYLI